MTGALGVGTLLGSIVFVTGPALWWSLGHSARVFQAVPDEALERCDADPSGWSYAGDKGVQAWALGEHGPLNASAPTLPWALQQRLRWEREPVVPLGWEHGLLVQRREGVCGTILVRWPVDGEVRRDVGLLIGLGLVLAVIGTVLLGWIGVLRPLLDSVASLNRASRTVGSSQFPSAEVLPELAPIQVALDEAHGRLVDERLRLERHLADTAHDLRSPLAALQLRMERIANGDLDAVPGAMADLAYLDMLTENLALVGQGGELQPAVGRADAVAVAQRVVDRFSVLGRRLGVEVIAALPDTPTAVSGPPVYLEQILGNLVHNAVRHHDRDGTVVVVVEPGKTVRIEVSDDGPGHPDTLPRNRSASDQRHGLGLSIVRQLVQHLGGSMAITAGEPRGLVVTLLFPTTGPPQDLNT